MQTPIVATPEDDFGGAGLGMLLRHAGPSWDGGRHGFEALSSFKGLCTTFEQYGMPKTERWRMCIGSRENWHSPEVLPPSNQDDYNVSTGVKCQCSDVTCDPKGKWTLARDCDDCSERCPHVECCKARKDMIRFEYFPIGPMLAKLCSCRSICHELLAMWRERETWLHSHVNSRKVYKEWWHGSRAAELAYFWDPEREYELPVLCRNCYKCYATLPTKCEELRNRGNWDESSKQYDMQCSDCGKRLTECIKTTRVSNFKGSCFKSPVHVSGFDFTGSC